MENVKNSAGRTFMAYALLKHYPSHPGWLHSSIWNLKWLQRISGNKVMRGRDAGKESERQRERQRERAGESLDSERLSGRLAVEGERVQIPGPMLAWRTQV